VPILPGVPMRLATLILLATAATAVGQQPTGVLRVSREAATVQRSQITAVPLAVNTFDPLPDRAGSGGGYLTVTPSTATFDGGSVSPPGGTGVAAGTYTATGTGMTLSTPNQFGGAETSPGGGSTNFLILGPATGADPRATWTAGPSGTAFYFGMWWSALDGNNSVLFYRNGQIVDVLTGGRMLADTGLDLAYNGNPNQGGANAGEKYVFVNVYADATSGFDRIDFVNAGDSGFETDSHTVAYQVIALDQQSGTFVPVPEPTGGLVLAAAILITCRRTRSRPVKSAAA
jgi:hypothetical protein